MPASPQKNAYDPQQPLPQHLDHKPVYAFPYEKFDGIHINHTDMRYLSIGIAQYNSYEVSIKTMRHTGTKWTRQAEELPLHRVIDMTIFLAKVLFEKNDQNIIFSKETFHKQNVDVPIIAQDGLRTKDEIKYYNAFIDKYRELYKERLNVLLHVLTELKRKREI